MSDKVLVDKFQDKLGNDVSVGDFIAYGVRSGNSGDLKIGKVTCIRDTARGIAISVREAVNKMGGYRLGGVGTLIWPNRTLKIGSEGFLTISAGEE